MILVLNEWIFHDLLGDNGAARQREAAAFLNALYASTDNLVLPREKRWLDKAGRLMRLGDGHLVDTRNQLLTLILDPNRAIDVRTSREDVPDDLRVPKEDEYLVEAYLSASADLLVTTDGRLCESLAGSRIACRLRDEFLAGYGPNA